MPADFEVTWIAPLPFASGATSTLAWSSSHSTSRVVIVGRADAGAGHPSARERASGRESSGHLLVVVVAWRSAEVTSMPSLVVQLDAAGEVGRADLLAGRAW